MGFVDKFENFGSTGCGGLESLIERARMKPNNLKQMSSCWGIEIEGRFAAHTTAMIVLLF